MTYNFACITYRIASRKRESNVIEESRQTMEECKWNPPLNFRKRIKGAIISTPSSSIPRKLPITTIKQIGITLNIKLYAAYSYRVASSWGIAPAFTNHFAMPRDTASITWFYWIGSGHRGSLFDGSGNRSLCLHRPPGPSLALRCT